MIILYQFPPLLGLPNCSPFCLKIETYLRMQEIPYEVKYVNNPRTAPKGKLPFIKDGETYIADSEFIIKYLEKKVGNSLDKHLSKDQKAQALLLEKSLSEYLYWIIVYNRWQNEQIWPFIKEAYFAKLPFPAKLFIPALVRKSTLKALYSQGMGRHTKEEIFSLSLEIINAIALNLGEQKYFFGELSTIDSTAFAFLVNMAASPYQDEVKNQLYQHKNLLLYCDRMWNNFYPEIAKPFALNEPLF